jgi:hypothetical protein
MDDVAREDIGDRHLNLFYTYRTNHLEDNITRALILTLRNLAPVHLRLFLRDIILSKSKQVIVRERMQLLTDDDFRFELQVSPPEERLDAKTGVIVGVNYSGAQSPTFDATYLSQGGARPDALVIDAANDFAVLFEIKLSDSLYRKQIERHFHSFFDQSSTTLNQVFVEISWSEIAEFLQRIVRQTVSERERFIVSNLFSILIG